MHTKKRPCGNGGRGYQPRNTKDCPNLLEAERETWNRIHPLCPEPSEETNSANTLIPGSGLLTSEEINLCCFKPPVCGAWWQQPEEVSTCLGARKRGAALTST